MLQVFPPGDQTPEAWLSRYAKPTMLPDWPRSTQVAVVAVWEVGETTEGWVMLDRAELDSVLAREELVLFFVVPRSILTEENCPGVKPELFRSE